MSTRRNTTTRRRRGQRGAVVVEAAMMFPLIVSFFVLNLFIYGTYRTKIDVQGISRQAGMYYATHSCQVTSPLGGTAGMGMQTESGVNNNKAPNAQQVLPQRPESSKVSSLASMFINTSTSSETGKFSYFGHSATLTSNSYTLCNEELWGGDYAVMLSLAGFFALGLSFFAQLIGGFIASIF